MQTNKASNEKAYRAVELAELLEAREKRASFQQQLLDKYQKPIVCFTMNIAGPDKRSYSVDRAFYFGAEIIKNYFSRLIVFETVKEPAAGNEAYYVIDETPELIKAFCCEVEDKHPIGRLFDMDVIDKDGRKLERTQLGYRQRSCLICGMEGKGCASRRVHALPEIEAKTRRMLDAFLKEKQCLDIGNMAVKALLYELAVSPKPGLVDRYNSGSHKDMNYYSFINSAVALGPYFTECAKAGYSSDSVCEELLNKIRPLGKMAEADMNAATGGVNAHKGAIFSLGILSCALGYVCSNSPKLMADSEFVLNQCKLMCSDIERDFERLTADTAKTQGERLYLKYGIKGIRGMMSSGLREVLDFALPCLESLLDRSYSIDEAGSTVLMQLIARVTDTNMITRGGIKLSKEASSRAGKITEKAMPADEAVLRAEDDYYIKNNLSPGGCADLLAVSFMLYFAKKYSAGEI